MLQQHARARGPPDIPCRIYMIVIEVMPNGIVVPSDKSASGAIACKHGVMLQPCKPLGHDHAVRLPSYITVPVNPLRVYECMDRIEAVIIPCNDRTTFVISAYDRMLLLAINNGNAIAHGWIKIPLCFNG